MHSKRVLLPGFEGPNLNASGVEVVRKRKFRQGEKAMTRSAHTFLWKSKRVAGMAIGAIAMLAVAGPALAQATGDEVFQVKTVIQVPGRIETSPFFSFDISWFDPTHKKFFLTDRNSLAIDVVDALNPGAGVTQQFVRPFAGVQASPDTSGPDGVLTANNDTELWIGDSPGKVWVLNSQTGDLIALPGSPTGNPILVKTTGSPPVNASTTRADELCYDPKDNIIMIASPAETPTPFVTFISAADGNKGKVLGQITFGDPATGIEQCGWSPTTGKFYQNLPGDPGGQDQVAVITPSTTTGGVVDHFINVNINDCSGLRGMAIGPNNQILLGCNAPSPGGSRNSIVIDATSGTTATVLNVLTGQGGVDQVWFNPADGHYVLPSCNTPCRSTALMGPELLFIVDSSGFSSDSTVRIANQNGVTTPLPPPNPRVVHSAAAGPAPGGNLIFLPIPAVGGTVPQWGAPGGLTLCDLVGDFTIVGGPSSLTGCIAILQAPASGGDDTQD